MSLLKSKKTYSIYITNKNGLSRPQSSKIYYLYILRKRTTHCVGSIFMLFRVKGNGTTFTTALWINPFYLKQVSAEPQGSAKGCQRFRETKMFNGERVLLVVINWYVRIYIRVATFDANHSVTDITQTVNCFFSSEASWLQASQSAQLSLGLVDVSGETIRLSISLGLTVNILRVTYIKDKQMLVFSLIIDLLWTISSLAFLVFCALI